MKNFIRDYFTFNRKERKGVLLLSGIIAALLLWLGISRLFRSEEQYDLSSFEKDITAFEDSQKKDSIPSYSDSDKTYSDNEYKLPSEYEVKKPERFDFDPNGLPEEDWKRLGLTDKQVRTIKNYESKGGKFKKKEDVKKMYCIKPELYASLEPYIHIKEKEKELVADIHTFQPSNFKPKAVVQVDINTADSLQLDQLKGIGPSFAKRIIKYRDLLGGFVRMEQLKEVYGIDSSLYALVVPQLLMDTLAVKRININTATLDQLKRHPYIKYTIANLIVNYRKQHGPYQKLSDLRKLDLVNEELYRKIAPYLMI